MAREGSARLPLVALLALGNGKMLLWMRTPSTLLRVCGASSYSSTVGRDGQMSEELEATFLPFLPSFMKLHHFSRSTRSVLTSLSLFFDSQGLPPQARAAPSHL